LGGNGVADSTVFGGIAGDAMAAELDSRPAPIAALAPLREAARAALAPLGHSGRTDLYGLLRQLRAVMWDRAGLVRDAEGLTGALAEIDRIEAGLADVGVPGRSALNLAWQDWLNLRSQTTTARLIVSSALERRESRGAHFRRDFPKPSEEPLYFVRVERGRQGPRLSRESVVLKRARPARDQAAPATVEIGD
jgi:fumarate reductase flavoprotein subunit